MVNSEELVRTPLKFQLERNVIKCSRGLGPELKNGICNLVITSSLTSLDTLQSVKRLASDDVTPSYEEGLKEWKQMMKE